MCDWPFLTVSKFGGLNCREKPPKCKLWRRNLNDWFKFLCGLCSNYIRKQNIPGKNDPLEEKNTIGHRYRNGRMYIVSHVITQFITNKVQFVFIQIIMEEGWWSQLHSAPSLPHPRRSYVEGSYSKLWPRGIILTSYDPVFLQLIYTLLRQTFKRVFLSSRKHAYIILTPLNPTFIK